MTWPCLALRAKLVEDAEEGIMAHDTPWAPSVYWPCHQHRARIADDRARAAAIADAFLTGAAMLAGLRAHARGEKPS